MRSIKPGRGPSRMNGVSSIFVAVFGIIWTISAASMGAPFFFLLFGLVFIGIAVYQAIYHFKNANSPQRHSIVDIVDANEEPDPLNQPFSSAEAPLASGEMPLYCSHCGRKLPENANFCPGCGKKLR